MDKWINPCFEALYTSYFLSWKFETWDSLRDSKQVYIFCMSIWQEDISSRSLCFVASALSSLSLAEDGEPEGGWEELVLQTCYLIGWTVAAGLIKETPTGLGGRRWEDSDSIFTGEKAKCAQNRSPSSSCSTSFLSWIPHYTRCAKDLQVCRLLAWGGKIIFSHWTRLR